MTRPGQDPATLRAVATDLDREARKDERRALSLFGFAQEATHADVRAERGS